MHGIIEITHEPLQDIVYNITTEDNHNFYVGEKEILVHNGFENGFDGLAKVADFNQLGGGLFGKTYDQFASHNDLTGPIQIGGLSGVLGNVSIIGGISNKW